MQRWYPMGLLGAALFTACASAPEGPTILVLKGGTKTFQQFAQDDTVCRRFAALEARGAPPDQALRASSWVPSGGHDTVPELAITERCQQLYDIAYAQCMDDKGHRVPVSDFVPEQSPDVPLLPPPPMPPLPDAAQ